MQISYKHIYFISFVFSAVCHSFAAFKKSNDRSKSIRSRMQTNEQSKATQREKKAHGMIFTYLIHTWKRTWASSIRSYGEFFFLFFKENRQRRKEILKCLTEQRSGRAKKAMTNNGHCSRSNVLNKTLPFKMLNEKACGKSERLSHTQFDRIECINVEC